MTPANKAAAEDMFGSAGAVGGAASDVGYSSSDGNKFLIDTGASFGAGGASGQNSYLFARGPGSWTLTSLAAPSFGAQSLGSLIYDASAFTQVGVVSLVGSAANVSTFVAADVVGRPGGPYKTLYSSHLAERAEMVGGSSDLSRVLLESTNHQLAPGDAGQDPETNALYEWVDGQIRLVNVNIGGSLLNTCGAVLGQNPGFTGGYHNAVSGDGSKIFFTAPQPRAKGAGCWDGALSNPPELYMRLNGATTVDLSAPEPGVNDPSGRQPAIYVGASADGSKVFFMTQTELTADDTGHAPELYEYDTKASTQPLTRISHGVSGNPEGDVRFVPAISSDGSTVYFVADGQLAPGAPGGGQAKLYRYDTNTETTTYVAPVSEEDYPSTAPVKWYPGAFLDEVGLAVNADWYTTSDGRFLVFGTRQALTGYDNTEGGSADCENYNGGGGANGHCYELYRFDAATDNITCVSCNPSGAAPVSNARFARSALRADNPAGMPPRPVSEDGGYVFFDSADALVPNAHSGVLHVYEWHDGKISLISAAGDSDSSFFLGSSTDGSNVFIGTHAQLAPQDTDGSGDLYDARIDGGFGQPAAPECTGTCQSMPTPPPLFTAPVTVTVGGGDNLALPSLKAGGLPSRRQQLAKALKKCKTKHNKRKRAVCEAKTRRKYSVAASVEKSNRGGNR
jgi:hypothetical protein